MLASTVAGEEAGNEIYQQNHMSLLFEEGFSFSGYERDSLFLNQAGRTFTDISGVSGIDSLSDGRAAALGDFDNDGDLDVFVTTIQGEGHLLFRNNVGQERPFLRVTLEGRASGRDAFSAVVRLKTSQGILTTVKSGGNGFLAQHDPRLLFGLGGDPTVEWMEVTWPSGKVQRWSDLKAGTSWRIVEGQEEMVPLTEGMTRLPDPLSREEIFWSKLRVPRGGPFPALRLSSLEEPENNLSLEPGVPYFLNLWATWCGPCRQEMPELQKLLPHFEARGIRLVGVNLDQEVEASQIRAFAQELGVTYPLYRADVKVMEGLFGQEVLVPFSFFVDGEGKAVEVFAGWSARTEEQIHRLLGLR